jgi:hypothetical protein
MLTQRLQSINLRLSDVVEQGCYHGAVESAEDGCSTAEAEHCSVSMQLKSGTSGTFSSVLDSPRKP